MQGIAARAGIGWVPPPLLWSSTLGRRCLLSLYFTERWSLLAKCTPRECLFMLYVKVYHVAGSSLPLISKIYQDIYKPTWRSEKEQMTEWTFYYFKIYIEKYTAINSSHFLSPPRDTAFEGSEAEVLKYQCIKDHHLKCRPLGSCSRNDNSVGLG